MSDLIERLRERNRKCLKCGDETCNFCRERTEAADEIERLRAVVDAVRFYGFPDGTAAGDDISEALAALQEQK